MGIDGEGTAIFTVDGDIVGDGDVDVIDGGELMRNIDMFGMTVLVEFCTTGPPAPG